VSYAPGTLWDAVTAGAARFGAAPAVSGIFDGAPATLTFSQLRDHALIVAAGLAGAGLGPGDVIAIWLPNWTDWLVLEAAAARLGSVVLGLNTRFRAHEMAAALSLARPRIVVRPRQFMDIDFDAILGRALEMVAAAGSRLEPEVVLAGPGDRAGAGQHDFRALLGSRYPLSEATDTVSPDLTANLFTTSGSTAAPKLAAHSQGALARHARCVAARFGLGPGDATLGILPLCGAFGLNAALATMSAGGNVALEQSYDPARAADLIAGGRITHLYCGDDVLAQIIAGTTDRGTLGRLRRGGIADFGGRLGELVAEVEAQYAVRLSGIYGSSECFAFTAAWPVEAPASVRGRSGGVPLAADIEWRIADPGGTCARLAAGQIGELHFRGYNVLESYFGNPAATVSARTEDGWFASGDLGYEADGGFVFVGRNTETLRVRGFLVDPAETAAFLRERPGVQSAAAVRFNGRNGDELVAFVTCRPGRECAEADLLSTCRAELATFKVPVRVHVLDELPMTAGTNGAKVDLVRLRSEAYERSQETDIE
jgi:acyl-CoA synthetase (AMP-forming)/AMP-acid ligase II